VRQPGRCFHTDSLAVPFQQDPADRKPTKREHVVEKPMGTEKLKLNEISCFTCGGIVTYEGAQIDGPTRD
tara:strand:- start:1251 stop:1460 length:210 start_codon:yes stop_codon:yes gene_type:complete